MRQNERHSDQIARLQRSLSRWRLACALVGIFAACATVQALRRPAPPEQLSIVQARLLDLAREIRP